MAFLSISVLTTEYVRVPVALTNLGLPVDPSALPVQFAFPLTGISPVTWVNGSWEKESDIYLARTLIGPGAGGYALAVGSYDTWLKFTSTPEIPVRNVGVLEVK